MPRTTHRLPLALAVAALLTACQSYPTPLAPGAAASAVAAASGAAIGPRDQRVILEGRVQWSDLYRLRAAASDVANSATVTLLNAAGTPVAAGLADSSGAFTLYQSTTPFTPVVDATYKLEVSRRGATDGSETLLSLRTVLKYTASGWTSITGTTIVISALTTAVTQLEEDDPSVGPADVIGTVTAGVASAFGNQTVPVITARKTAIDNKLTANVDPNQLGETITGNVTIATNGDVIALKRARKITGDLTINYSGTLALTFPQLQEIGGTLTLRQAQVNAADVTDLQGFSALKKIGATGGVSLSVTSESGLTSLTGLAGVTTLPGTLAASGAALTSLTGLDNLTAIDGDVQLSNLTAFTGLGALSKVVTIKGALKLTNLSAASLTSLGTLTSLTSCGSLTIDRLRNLTSLNAFPALTSLGSLELTDLDALTSLTGLQSAVFPQATASVHTIVQLTRLPLVTDLTGLAGLSGAVERLTLAECAAFADFTGIGNVTSIARLQLHTTAVSGFGSMPTTLTSLDEFSANNNDAPLASKTATDNLASLAGLANVTINETFSVGGFPDLAALTGPSFASAMVEFVVDDCDGLTTLGFANTQAIQSLSYGVRVENNLLLSSFGLTGLNTAAAGVKTIGSVGSAEFTFQGNPALTDPAKICEVVNLSNERLQGGVRTTDFTLGQINACPI